MTATHDAAGEPGAAIATTAASIPASRVAELAPLALVILAEAAWISVVSGLISGFAELAPVLGVPALALMVVIGIVTARVLGPRLGAWWPAAALALVALAVIVGWLASADARASLGGGNGLVAAVTTHPAGWVAGLALFRGFAHARLPVREDAVTHLFSYGVPGLVILAVVGGLIPEPYRQTFLADALAASVIFVVATTLAAALIRLTDIGQDSGFDWRRNPAWLGLVLVILAAAIAAAINLWVVGGSALQVVAGITVGVLLVVALAAGLEKSALRLVLILLVVQVVVYGLLALVEPGTGRPETPAVGPGAPIEPEAIDQVLTVSVGGLALLAAIVAVVVLAAIWMRSNRAPAEDLVAETRTIDRGAEGPAPRSARRRFGRRPEPTHAAAAYEALVADIASHEDVARKPAETPAEHAARLRALGRSELSLDFLAADYALVRYAEVELAPREDRRAIARWRALRQRLVTPTAKER